ncbi:MAG: aspartyl/asparaginyl beta-hydroxylase domain-containing protein [Rudaea sp.]
MNAERTPPFLRNAPERADVARELRAAHEALEQRRPDDATAALGRVLALDADNVAALHFLALQAVNAGRFDEALTMLEHAVTRDPDNLMLLKNLGVAYADAARLVPAEQTLSRAITLDAGFFIARLHLGGVLEELGREHDSLVQYFAAVTQAQTQGRWLSEASTAPAMRQLVLHAMNRIDAGRQKLFSDLLAPLVAAHGAAALARVKACVDVYLAGVAPQYVDPRQQPRFLYFPGLPTSAFFDRALFPWYAQLESNVDVIRAEMQAVLADTHGIEPFLIFESPEQASGYLAGEGAAPSWDAFFFYRHGERNDANCARCPHTAALIDALPLVRIREHAPEICFSFLTPGTHILPHRGVTNTRLVTHLPLVVPDDCAIVVGGESRVWREGECFTFDDTFEHEAWNRGTSTRAVMLIDCWNPHLSAVEREAVALVIAAIGDFNHAAGIVDT